MTNVLVIGIVAGLCAALLFAWSATGEVPARAAFALLTGLPLATAAAGWGFGAAVIGGSAASAALGLIVSPNVAFAFFATQALPIIALTYLAGLSRVGPDGSTEWYPAGRIVIWAAIIASLVTFGVLMLIGTDMAAIKTAIRGFVETFATKQFPELSGGKALGPSEIDDLAGIAMVLLPAAMAISVMGTMLLNLWLGGHIAKASGVLSRAWPDLASLTFPRGAPLMLAIATAGTFLSGLPGLAAAAFFGAMFLAYVLAGLAVIHHVTRGHPWRSFALWGIYGGLIVFNTFASLLIALLGLADTIRPLRQGAQPPDPPNLPGSGQGPSPPPGI